MSVWGFVLAAGLLSIERLCYLWIWRDPEAFRAFCERFAGTFWEEPVEALQKLFYGFKGLQVVVFVTWCYGQGHGFPWPPSGGALGLGLGAVLVVLGQMLNVSVFYRLGKVGVFYGNKLGYSVPWCQAFPFSLLQHPQYVGTLLSIWGFFLIMCFPHDTWYVLPALETVYYTVGAYLER